MKERPGDYSPGPPDYSLLFNNQVFLLDVGSPALLGKKNIMSTLINAGRGLRYG